jgi:hypothetical protein
VRSPNFVFPYTFLTFYKVPFAVRNRNVECLVFGKPSLFFII